MYILASEADFWHHIVALTPLKLRTPAQVGSDLWKGKASGVSAQGGAASGGGDEGDDGADGLGGGPHPSL